MTSHGQCARGGGGASPPLSGNPVSAPARYCADMCLFSVNAVKVEKAMTVACRFALQADPVPSALLGP